MERKWKEYPNQISDEFVFTKSQEYFYLKVQPELEDVDKEAFLEEKKEFFDFRNTLASEPTTVTTLNDSQNPTLGGLIHLSIEDGVIVKPLVSGQSIDEAIGQIETDERVDIAGPLYFREDIGYPPFFTFKDKLFAKFEEEIDAEKLQALLENFGIEKIDELNQNLLVLRVRNKKDQNTHEVAENLKKVASVKFARVSWTQISDQFLATPNNTYFKNQWNLARINAPTAWNISKGSPLVVIAIIDSGCDLTHKDLSFQLVQKERWFDETSKAGQPNDNTGHGTLCAGIASAATNSPIPTGVAGVGWSCRIMPIRINANGSIQDEDCIVKALVDARCCGEKSLYPGWRSKKSAHVISMSWKWEGSHALIDGELRNCYDAGIVMFAAAGNSAVGQPDKIAYPACSNYVIAVGASNENDDRCTSIDWPGLGGGGGGSQYGNELAIIAPGVNIIGPDITGAIPNRVSSDYKSVGFPIKIVNKGWNNLFDYLDNILLDPLGTQRQGIGDGNGEYYFKFYGTSAATPHVAGVAGLMLAYNPTLKPDDIRTILKNTAEKVVGTIILESNYNGNAARPGWNKFKGYGLVNAEKALQNINPYGPASVHIRDSLQDTGAPYQGGQLDKSPDIIVRQNEVMNSQTVFANKNVDPGSDSIAPGKTNWIYVRVHNNGIIDSDIHLRLYYAPVASYTPDLWVYVNQYDFYKVPKNSMVVSDKIEWPKEKLPPLGATNVTLIASIEGVRDPHPDPLGISSAAQFWDFIRTNNNVCCRNLV